MLKVWLFRIACVILLPVPRRLGCALACSIGSLAYYLAPARHAVKANIRTVLGPSAAPAKVSQVARGVFCNAAKNYFDLFRVPKLNVAELSSLVRTYGFEHLQEALAEKKGVVVVTAHLGNFDVCGQEIAARSLNMMSLVEPLQPPELFEIVKRLRESKGVRFVPVGPSALKESVKTLRRGDVIGIACDRDIQRTGIKIPFFGRLASIPQGGAHLALRTGALVVPAFGERLPDDTFKIYIEPPLQIEKTGDFEVDVRTLMAAIVKVIEKHIGARPDQWVVFERIWPD